MDVKEAVNAAKHHVETLFGDQLFSAPMLEEIEFDSADKAWNITIGFLRMPELALPGKGQGAHALGLALSVPRRAYKVVRISDQAAAVMSVKDR